MHRRWTRITILCGVAVLGVITPQAGAAPLEQASTDSFPDGTFRFVGGEKQRQEVERAIERATEDMNFIIRGIARKRLRKSISVHDDFGVAFPGRDIAFTFPSGSTVRSPADGRYVQWENSDGDELRVSQRLDSDNKRIRQVFDHGDGARRNVYVLHGNGRSLTLYSRVSAERLPEDVRFSLSYRLSD